MVELWKTYVLTDGEIITVSAQRLRYVELLLLRRPSPSHGGRQTLPCTDVSIQPITYELPDGTSSRSLTTLLPTTP